MNDETINDQIVRLRAQRFAEKSTVRIFTPSRVAALFFMATTAFLAFVIFAAFPYAKYGYDQQILRSAQIANRAQNEQKAQDAGDE